MMRYGFSGTSSWRTTSGGGPAGAARPRAPSPRQAASARRVPQNAATSTRARTGMLFSLTIGVRRGGVVRRRTAREPRAERVRIVGQTPFLEDRQRHRPHAALGSAGGEALLVQPGFEIVRVGIGGDRALEQLPLHRQADGVGGRIPLAPPPPPFGGVERRQQLAAHVARPGQVAHAALTRTSSAYAGRSGRWYPRSNAATSRCTVMRSSSRTAQGASGRIVVSPLRYPWHVLHTS